MAGSSMRRGVPAYAVTLAAVAGGLALLGIVYQAGVRPAWLERYHLVWRLKSDELANEAYARLLDGKKGEALRLFALALERDPASPYRWCDYGEALLAAGERERAGRAMERGMALGPAAAPVVMRGVNFAFRTGDEAGALRQGRRLLALAPEYEDTVFTAWERMGLPANAVLAAGLPDRRSGQAYMRRMLGKRDFDAAAGAWAWLRGQHFADDKLADAYAGALVAGHRYAEAWQGWTAYAAAREPGYPERNAIFNGSFEREAAGAVFDWRMDACEGAAAARVADRAAEGKESLRLVFDGSSNVRYGHVSQRAVLAPGAYRLEARVRTEEITTDEGIGLRVADAENATLLDARTERLTGTHEWTLLAVSFSVRAGTRLVEVRVVRDASLKFDNKLGGTAWVDGVVLRAGAGKAGAPGGR